jgi:hypothetical protein
MEAIMTTNIADVVLHIDEMLPPEQVKTLERHLYEMGGVIEAFNREDRPNLIQVKYDTGRVRSRDILLKVRKEGIHAELIGL